MSDSVQQIKERLSIVDVVSQYVELHQAGKNLKGKSPFTSEKTPSFYVSPDRGMYYCFSSSQGGDIFTFVQQMEGVDFKGALTQLAERAGVELVPEDPKKKTERDRQYEVLEAATKFYSDWLVQEKEAAAYLERRGVKPQTIAHWRIGYAPGPPTHGWRDTKSHLEEGGFSESEMSRAGLIKGGDNGKAAYDVFRDRVVFPIFDPSGRVVGFSGRILAKDSEAPKYVNSPDTELFNKSEILFGYDKAKQGIRKFDFSLIVEGQFDVIMSHQVGYTNAVAVSGTALTDHQAALLQRLSQKVVLALDADKAGVSAVKRGAVLMLARGMDVKVAKLPDGNDPADLAALGGDQLKEVIKHSTHVIEFLLDVIESEAPDARAFKLKAHSEVLPFIVRIPNRIDQEHFEQLVADRLGTTKDAVHAEVERLRAKAAASASKEVPKTTAPEVKKVATDPRQYESVKAHVVLVSEIVEKKLGEVVAKEYETITGESTDSAKSTIEPTIASELLFTLEDQYNGIPLTQRKADLAHMLQRLAELHYREELRQAHASLRQAESQGTDSKEAMQAITGAQKKLGECAYTADIFEEEQLS